MNRPLCRCVVGTTLVALFISPLGFADEPPEKAAVILDTDIGTDIDDAFALALALQNPEIELKGVTTVGGDAMTRARIACRMLTAAGRREVPVAAGAAPQPKQELRGFQAQYAGHPAMIFNRMAQPLKESAVEFLYRQLKADPGKITLCCAGPLTNIARLLKDHPDCKPWIKRIVLMGGAVRIGYNGKPPAEAEWNIKTDIGAARAVFTSGVPLLVAPLDATLVPIDAATLKRIFDAGSLLNLQLKALHQLWDQKEDPVLFDPVAVALCFTERFCTIERMSLEISDQGVTRVGDGRANCSVARAIRSDDFRKWLVERFTAKATIPAPLKALNPSKLIERNGVPNRVHAFEDYETDVERRWWMSGKLESADLPSGSKRACRGVLTQDFDDRMGDMKAMYTAVIFNPVPGPPMGKSPRLSFRYKLQGSDHLRVQIYSLSKGYHRCLTLTGLPQGEWREGTVDMTQVRRPDGSGGPLSEDERIDDIQFYTDARAELLIDDIVLYDAAIQGEKRPFPKRVLFTGWFDTGKQGKEWPGDFEIAQKQGYFWHAAKSVIDSASGEPWLRVHLRGPQPIGAATALVFRYRLTGTDAMSVVIANGQKEIAALDLKGLKKDEWAQASVDLSRHLKAGGSVDEMRFRLPRGANLLLDDLLLYEP